jgi:hypothetical protein
MPTTNDTAHLLDLKRRIDKLSLGDQLRVVAACLDDGKDDIAETLASYVVDILRAKRLFNKVSTSASLAGSRSWMTRAAACGP